MNALLIKIKVIIHQAKSGLQTNIWEQWHIISATKIYSYDSSNWLGSTEWGGSVAQFWWVELYYSAFAEFASWLFLIYINSSVAHI